MQEDNRIKYLSAAGVLVTLAGVLGILLEWNRYAVIFLVVLGAAIPALSVLTARNHAKKLNTAMHNANRNREWEELRSSDLWNRLPFREELDRMIDERQETLMAKRDMEDYDRQATLQALQSQINPHFLYNTLECIRGQALLDDNREIATMLEALGDFFRYSISRKENIVLLRDEIQNIRGYLLIQNYRFPDRFDLELEYLEDQDLLDSCYVPKLMLQPIVENSILHAFENKLKGTIVIQIDADEEHLLITVSDNGDGMEESVLKELNARIRGERDSEPRPVQSHGNGIALENVNKRIAVLFGKQYGMQVYSSPGTGTDVEIILPRKQDDRGDLS